MKGAWSDKQGWATVVEARGNLDLPKPAADCWPSTALAYVLGLLSMGGAVLVCQHLGWWP